MRTIAAMTAAAAVSGCVSVKDIPMKAPSAEEMRGRQLSLAQREKPNFIAATPGVLMFLSPMLGTMQMFSEGNELIAKNGVEDPAMRIAEMLAADLKARFNLVRAPGPAKAIASDDLAELAKAGAGSDLVLEVRTIEWKMASFEFAPTRYRVVYKAKLRLLDAKRSQLLAEGGCIHAIEDSATAPSYDQLVGDNAAGLKQELGKAAAFCADEIRTKTLFPAG